MLDRLLLFVQSVHRYDEWFFKIISLESSSARDKLPPDFTNLIIKWLQKTHSDEGIAKQLTTLLSCDPCQMSLSAPHTHTHTSSFRATSQIFTAHPVSVWRLGTDPGTAELHIKNWNPKPGFRRLPESPGNRWVMQLKLEACQEPVFCVLHHRGPKSSGGSSWKCFHYWRCHLNWTACNNSVSSLIPLRLQDRYLSRIY